MKLGLAALLLAGCAAAPILVEAPRSSEVALVLPVLVAVPEVVEPPPETRDEQLDRCDRIERDAPICDEVPRSPVCLEVVATIREVVARCRELADQAQ